jgi:hypothetical protein
LDGHCDRWRRVDHCQPETLLAKDLEIGGEPSTVVWAKAGMSSAVRSAIGERTLRVISMNDRPCARQLLHRKMSGQVVLPDRLSAMPMRNA